MISCRVEVDQFGVLSFTTLRAITILYQTEVIPDTLVQTWAN
jgi:hypothetical protein